MEDNHIFELVKILTAKAFKSKGEYFIIILENWDYLTPKNWLTTYPTGFKWNSSNTATLIVGTSSASLSLKLNFEKNIVINNINTFLGHNIINNIKFVIK